MDATTAPRVETRARAARTTLTDLGHRLRLGPVGSAARWLTRDALARAAMGLGARFGGEQAAWMSDPTFLENPYPAFEQLRERGPLISGGRAWISADHAVCAQALKAPNTGAMTISAVTPAWLRALRSPFEPDELVGALDPPAILALDPPEHTVHRRLVSSVFTARAVAGLREGIERRTRECLDALAAEAVDGAVIDLVPRFAARLPLLVICDLLGVPVERQDDLLTWTASMVVGVDVGLTWQRHRNAESGLRSLREFMRDHLRELAAAPGDDFLSRLVRAEVDGRRLTERELMVTATLLLAAGFETTSNLIASLTVRLAEQPDQLALLQADPTLWGNAVEEGLRIDPPVFMTGRRPLQPLEIAGERLGPGQILALVVAGANRDPKVFTDPDRFDVTRTNAREHLSFGAGIHFCLGAALARMESEIALRGLFERFPQLQVAGTPVLRDTRAVRGYAHVPVRLL